MLITNIHINLKSRIQWLYVINVINVNNVSIFDYLDSNVYDCSIDILNYLFEILNKINLLLF